MADVEMPQLGETVTEGTITKWFKAVGDQVAADEVLFEVSTDKVDSEVPSPAGGVLTEILVPEGETVDVGTKLAVIGDAAAAGVPAPAEPAPAAEPEPAPRAEAPPAAAPPAAASPPPPPPPPPAAPAAPAAAPPAAAPAGSANGSGGGLLLSPVVRKLINEHGLDPATITGTGAGGRITRSDVLAAAESRSGTAPAAPPAAPAAAKSPAARQPAPEVRAGEHDTSEPFNNIRRRTAEHMVMSKAVSAHALIATEVDFEGVERVRRAHGEAFKADEGFTLTYLPFISLAVVDALREFPHVNASVGDGALILHHDINLGIAVDLDFAGLIVPVIHGADGKRLRAIAREVSELAGRARSRQLSADDISGGTFTITNPGPFGTFITGAIINQPQVAILSTDGIKRRPVVVEGPDGSEAIAIHSVGMLVITWDHRAFDGAYAAAFVRRVQEIIETRDWAAEARMTAAMGRARSLRVRWLGRVRYRDADALMHALAERSADDHLLLVEHPPTYTLGVRADPAHVLVPPSEVGAELVRADRGGDVTYHGPGQLVAYPVLTLPGKGAGDQPDTVAYVHAVEQLVIDTLADVGLPGASRLEGYPGVWLGADGPTPRKIAAIGVRIKRGRSLHGLALNVHPDLAMFGHIVPCGIPDKAVTSLAAEGVPATMREVADALVARATAQWGAGLTVERADLAWRAPRLAAFSTTGSAGTASAAHAASGPAISPQRQARLSEAGVTEGLQIAARKPEWARAKVRITPEYLKLKHTMRDLDLTTVCEEAGCPNIFECWADGTGTFMINGERCTRACGFCLVDTSKPLALDPAEPEHVADAVASMGLSYAVVTCVARDDLPDGGAGAFAATIHAVRRRSPEARVEVLISDCKGDPASLDTVFAARPDVLNHNIETVLRLQRAVRPSAGYARSLAVLARAKAAGLVTKSSLMVGIGETDDEVAATFADLHAVGVDIVTVGQYLRPTAQHLPVTRWVTPEQFERFRVVGEDLGIPHVESSPLTRSSHHAAQAYERVTSSGRMATADATTRP